MPIFISTVFVITLTGTLIFLLGKLILRLLKISFPSVYTEFYILLVTSVSLLVVIIALWSTKFNTIFLGALSLTVLYFFLVRKSALGGEKTRQNFDYFTIYCEWIFIFLVCYFVQFDTSNFIPSHYVNIPSEGYAYLARASFHLVDNGIETPFFNPFFDQHNIPVPYYYFDLWFNGALSSILGTHNNLINLLYITYPLGVSVIWVGFCAIISSYKKLTFFDKVIAFAGVFVFGSVNSVSINLNTFFFNLTSLQLLQDVPQTYLISSVWNSPALFPVYWYGILAILFIQLNNFRAAYFSLLLLANCCVPIALPIILGLLGFLQVSKILNIDTKTRFSDLIAMTVFTLAFIALFYIANNSLSAPASMSFSSQEIWRFFLSAARRITDGLIQTFNIYLFWLIPIFAFLAVWIVKMNRASRIYFLKNPTALLFSSLFAASLIVWAFFSSFHYYTNFGLVFLNLFIFVAYVFIRSNNNFPIRFTISAFFLVLVYVNCRETLQSLCEEKEYSDEFLAKVEKIANDLSPISSVFISKEEYKNHNGDPQVDILGQCITLFRPDVTPVALSIFDAHFLTSDSSKYVRSHRFHPFVQFVKEQQDLGIYNSVVDSQREFIRRYKINNIILHGVILPPTLEEMVRVRIDDHTSAQTILLIDNNIDSLD